MANFAKLCTNSIRREEIQCTSHKINPKRFCHLDSQVTHSFIFCLLEFTFQDSYTKSLEIIRIQLHYLAQDCIHRIRGKFQVGTIPSGPPVILANYTNDHILNEINQGLIDCQVSLRYFNLLPCMVN